MSIDQDQMMQDEIKQPAPGIVVPRWVIAVLLVVTLFAGGVAIGRWGIDSNTAEGADSSSPTATQASTDPDATTLSRLIVQQGDVAAGNNVQLIPGGNQTADQTTLDLCNGNFPSESKRTARLQVVELDPQDTVLFSTEAVLYDGPDAATGAFDELKTVASNCPSTPVVSKVGEPTVTTKFKARPDVDWPRTATVDRLAYNFTTTTAAGETQRSVAVYLRRGRALLGIYFSQPDTPPTVAGQHDIAGIVHLFETRLAELPTGITTSKT